MEGSIGGIVIDASFQVSNGRPVYRIKAFVGWDNAASDQSVWEGMVDAQMGKVVGTSQRIALGHLDPQDRKGLAGLHAWDVSLGEAATAAEDYGGGKAIGVHLTERNGESIFEVTLVKNMSPINVAVDAINGYVIS